MKTEIINPNNIQRRWYIFDIANKTLGRSVTKIANYLRGKHKPEYAPNLDLGDHIIVINAAKVRVTGNKPKNKIYYHHSGYIGGMKTISFEKLLQKKPEQIIEKAVKGMLPKGPLGRKIFKKLKVYASDTHPHTAQQPEFLDI